MARRLTRGTAARVTGRPPGRPRKNGPVEVPGEVQERLPARRLRDSNVTDDTRREFLQRGQQALLVVEECRLKLSSAHRVYSAVIKDARSAGATQIAWTLKAMRRDPQELAAEIQEQNRMLMVAEIPLGTQLGFFEGVGETLGEVVAKHQGAESLVQAVERIWTKEDVTPAMQQAMDEVAKATHPPKPGPDEPGEPEEEEEDPEEPEEEDEPDFGEVDEPAHVAKAGNEILEDGEMNQNAYLMGQRSFKLERALGANPFNELLPTHGAWIRGWKSEQAKKTASR